MLAALLAWGLHPDTGLYRSLRHMAIVQALASAARAWNSLCRELVNPRRAREVWVTNTVFSTVSVVVSWRTGASVSRSPGVVLRLTKTIEVEKTVSTTTSVVSAVAVFVEGVAQIAVAVSHSRADQPRVGFQGLVDSPVCTSVACGKSAWQSNLIPSLPIPR